MNLRKILEYFASWFAYRDKEGYWGHDTCLGECEDAFDRTIDAIVEEVDNIMPNVDDRSETYPNATPEEKEFFVAGQQYMSDQIIIALANLREGGKLKDKE